MTEHLDDIPDGILDDPRRLLAAGRPAVRALIEDGGAGPGREVFLQAEAIFGGADVPRAEFAAWLQFAARMLGEHAYAERIAEAEPGMPWRTVWAWWRPVNGFVAQPSLTGYDGYAGRHGYGDGVLIEVRTSFGQERTWLDEATGRPVPAPDPDALTPAPGDDPADGTPDLADLELTAPECWEDASAVTVVEGRTRHLVESVHGIALIETDPKVLGDWPRGEIDWSSAEEGSPGPEPRAVRPEGPLTTARVAEVFGERRVLRLSEEELPDAVEHAGTREFLRGVGVPTYWACHGGEFELLPLDAWRAPADGELSADGLPQGVTPGDLLVFARVDYGRLYLHRSAGTVHIWTKVTRPQGVGHPFLIAIAPDLDVFTRCLEAINRYRNACWHPYPDEGDQEDLAEVYLAEMEELAPGLFERGTPSGELWSCLYAGITELSEDGF
ncbi:SUKH-4 family immunity protein [Streptomyces sp. TRM66268-LWL]|uniref:SUKH-4 family immunity protein n=1 Tax=Streptomyces polyasparticus TaxID=2767826 RepID=A0ABR7S7K8_9ACTN|nr:SUKH-4 family immunity protein [Streptomyces polyasparticus]MBC9711441.1 SUKH-4 family immunity protein [Streptomyces polyasparticus]